MFCTPRARPDQNGPARSATAVNASPLSATVTTVASTTSGIATGTSSPAVAPSSSIVAAAATVTQRSGRIRLDTTSESWPTAIRPERAGHLGQRDEGAGRGRGPVAVLDQPHQREGPHHELRHHEQHRDPVDAGQVGVRAVGVRRRRRPGRRPRRVDHHDGDQRRRQRAGHDRDPHRGVRPGLLGRHRHRHRGDAHAGRLRHLPDAHGQAAPRRREPADHDPPARHVAGRREHPGQPEAEREQHHRPGQRRQRSRTPPRRPGRPAAPAARRAGR